MGKSTMSHGQIKLMSTRGELVRNKLEYRKRHGPKVDFDSLKPENEKKKFLKKEFAIR